MKLAYHQRALRQLILVWIILLACLQISAAASPADISTAHPIAHSTAHSAKNIAVLLQINGPIGPAIADYLHRGIQRAAIQQAKLIILQIDTPGGLDKSMRNIITDILTSSVPVISYVAPSGARAASAGTYIIYASHIAAMAPGTNLGAATPVDLMNLSNTPQRAQSQQSKSDKTAMSTEELKILNDSKAYIRSLGQMRGRNSQWGEQAVGNAASLSAHEALKLHVIDVIAKDVNELLTAVNARVVQMAGKPITIVSDNLTVMPIAPDWRTKFLAVITDPSVAYILLMIGFYGLFFEFLNPGFLLPGVAGAIALLMGLYALQLLPIDYAGLILIVLGLIFIGAEAFVPSYGSLGIGGAVAFLLGSILLLKTNAPGFSLPFELIITVTVITLIFCLGLLQLAWRSRRRPIVTGSEALIGQIGEVFIDDTAHQVWVHLLGERWQVKSTEELHAHQQVKVIARCGLILEVIPVSTIHSIDNGSFE